MKIITALLAIVFILANPAGSFAATEKDKMFIDAYKKAFEAKDETTLRSFLYTKDAHPMALEFYGMMITSNMGTKIDSIELQDLTAEEIKEANTPQQGPDGKNTKLPLAAIKKLILKTQSSGAEGTSSGTSETLIADSNGKWVIPVPVPMP